MEQSTQTNNYERPKKKVGRPKRTGLFTDEENKEIARMRSRLYYSPNIEKKVKDNDYNIKQKKYCLKCLFLNFYVFEFLFKQLAN